MSNIEKLLDIMRALRDPDSGCDWDLAQDFASIAPYTVEEAYEVADAIERGDMPGLCDELGDLLLQVVFHAQMAAEAGYFDFSDVAGAIGGKMLRRHPHVFGSEAERSVGKRDGSWERIKQAERATRGDKGALAGVAAALPALKRAQKLGKRAAVVGFDWPNRAGVDAKIREELAELDEAQADGSAAEIEAELGDLLFAVVNLARHAGVDAETALAGANRRFERRFRHMEASLGARGESLAGQSLEALEAAWQAAKRALDEA